MNTQTQTTPANLSEFVIALPIAEFPPARPISANSCDYGFDFDEDELGRELLAPLPGSVAIPTIPEVGADEFEKVFQYFLS